MNLDYLNEVDSELMLDHRELREVGLSIEYIQKFNHGTSGHISYSVITKLIAIIEAQQAQIKRLSGVGTADQPGYEPNV